MSYISNGMLPIASWSNNHDLDAICLYTVFFYLFIFHFRYQMLWFLSLVNLLSKNTVSCTFLEN